MCICFRFKFIQFLSANTHLYHVQRYADIKHNGSALLGIIRIREGKVLQIPKAIIPWPNNNIKHLFVVHSKSRLETFIISRTISYVVFIRWEWAEENTTNRFRRERSRFQPSPTFSRSRVIEMQPLHVSKVEVISITFNCFSDNWFPVLVEGSEEGEGSRLA
jgi:hypothetical protein